MENSLGIPVSQACCVPKRTEGLQGWVWRGSASVPLCMTMVLHSRRGSGSVVFTAVFPVPRTVTDTWWMPNNYWLYE